MNNYSKNEKIRNAKEAESNRNVIKCHWINYLQPLTFSILVLYLFYLIAPDLFDYTRALIYDYDYPRVGKLMFMSLFISLIGIPLIYFIIRSIFVDLKGKLEYTDTSMHYEGYNFDFFPRKTIVELNFSEIAYMHIYVDKFGKFQREVMRVRKTDGTKIELNICYFYIEDTTKLMYQHLVDQVNALHQQDVKKFQITIHNHKGFIFGYLNLNIYVNKEMSNSSESTYTVNVKTGDILAIKRGCDTHIFRLQDPSLTHYYIDDSMNTFEITTAKE
jgi:hypothetical protein